MFDVVDDEVLWPTMSSDREEKGGRKGVEQSNGPNDNDALRQKLDSDLFDCSRRHCLRRD
jgi:hypothetical protein